MNDEFEALPHDIAAEMSVVGAMMLSTNAAEKAMQALSAGDFYRPAHGLVFTAVSEAHRADEPTDIVSIKDRLDRAGQLTAAGGPPYLFRLIEAVPTVGNVSHYAGIVRERAVRRRLIEAGRRIVQMASAQGEESHGIAERAAREIESVRDFDTSDDVLTPTIGEFLSVPDEEYDWIVPGLLERGDRMILTGVEGAGKSTLFRQLGVTIAAGIHPFTGEFIQPRRVLIIDSENGPAHIRRKIRPMVVQAERLGRPIAETNLWLEIRPEGFDLALDRDLSWLMRRIALIKPDVTLLGPLYRMVPRALTTDDDVAPILAAFNMIRARGSCVLVEAHSGHAIGPGGRRDPRPRGSSALLGWPEFGYGLRFNDKADQQQVRIVDLVPWRGDRDERQWPMALEAGGRWPWSEHIAGFTPPPSDDWSPTAVLSGGRS